MSQHNVVLNPGARPLRYALGIEAAFNFFGGSLMIAFPGRILSLVSPGEASNHVDLIAIQLLQWLGAMVFTLNVPLLLSIPEKDIKADGARRRLAYQTLLAGELLLIPIMAMQALSSAKSGFTPKALFIAISNLMPFVVFRTYALYSKPKWFGDAHIIDERKRT